MWGACIRRSRRNGGVGDRFRRDRTATNEKPPSQERGVHLDPEANRAGVQIISAPPSRVTVFVIPTDEERMIAEHTIRTAYVGSNGRESPHALTGDAVRSGAFDRRANFMSACAAAQRR
jgi:hypothetical protein